MTSYSITTEDLAKTFDAMRDAMTKTSSAFNALVFPSRAAADAVASFFGMKVQWNKRPVGKGDVLRLFRRTDVKGRRRMLRCP